MNHGVCKLLSFLSVSGVRLFGDSKLPTGLNVSVIGCVSVLALSRAVIGSSPPATLIGGREWMDDPHSL